MSEEVVVLVTADGAGSAAEGQLGAETAAREAACFCANSAGLFSDEAGARLLVDGAITAARAGLRNLSMIRDLPLRELATTLQVILVGNDFWAYGRVGDGGCVARCASELTAISPKPRNSYVNETDFITADNIEPWIGFESQSLEAVALFTDGLQHMAMRTAAWLPHDSFFRPLFNFATEHRDQQTAANALAAFLNSVEVASRSDDDRTLIISIAENGS